MLFRQLFQRLIKKWLEQKIEGVKIVKMVFTSSKIFSIFTDQNVTKKMVKKWSVTNFSLENMNKSLRKSYKLVTNMCDWPKKMVS